MTVIVSDECANYEKCNHCTLQRCGCECHMLAKSYFEDDDDLSEEGLRIVDLSDEEFEREFGEYLDE